MSTGQDVHSTEESKNLIGKIVEELTEFVDWQGAIPPFSPAGDGENSVGILKAILNHIRFLNKEIGGFEALVGYFDPSPGDIPELNGIDIYGQSLPKNGRVGGDHIIYIDFRKRYQLEAIARQAPAGIREKLQRTFRRPGLAVLDVEGHDHAAAFIAAVFHQAFLLGIPYELKRFGQITTNLFESINARFYNSSGIFKTLTMVYGEISENGTFRFLSAAHPPPKVFSNEFDRIVDISEDRLISFPQIGTMPNKEDSEKTVPQLGYKEKYTINEINLMGAGDILILYTDGLSDHRNRQGERYFPSRLEKKLREVKGMSAREIFERIREDLLDFNREPQDDIAFVIIKRS